MAFDSTNENNKSEKFCIDEIRKIIQSKIAEKNLKYQDVAKSIGVDPVFLLATLFGQQRLPLEASQKLAELLEIEVDITKYLTMNPKRSTDTFVTRLHEMMDLYGEAIKELTYENFGDGILSAVDVKVHFTRKGERALITIDSKFLPYKPY